jgi:hypothetical protein
MAEAYSCLIYSTHLPRRDSARFFHQWEETILCADCTVEHNAYETVQMLADEGNGMEIPEPE